MSFPSNITIDRGSPVPLYHQLVHGIESAITDGELPPGTMLENELALAKNLHLSRPTVRKAMDELVRSGLLVRKRGVGTQVVASEVRRPVRLTSLYDDLAQDASRPATAVLSLEEVPAPDEIARALSIEVSAPVYHMRRLRSRNGRPLAIMENWVSPGIATLKHDELEASGLYEILRREGVNFRVATQKIGAAVASAEQAKLLGTSEGAALVTMSRTATDDIGRRVETGRHLYRADSYSFELTLSA